MVHPQGLSSNPEFAGKIDTQRLYYTGGSLGGIIGGALTAVAPDFERAALIVPGFRFSLLLSRSSQFSRFAQLLFPTYPDPVEQALINSMVQLVWDRGEANAYA
jgi:predicted peptidase